MPHYAPPTMLRPLRGHEEIVKFVHENTKLFLGIAIQALEEAKHADYIKDAENAIGERVDIFCARLVALNAAQSLRKEWMNIFNKVDPNEREQIFYEIAYLFVGHEGKFARYSPETLKLLENEDVSKLQQEIRDAIGR
jgi:hypothetical protein